MIPAKPSPIQMRHWYPILYIQKDLAVTSTTHLTPYLRPPFPILTTQVELFPILTTHPSSTPLPSMLSLLRLKMVRKFTPLSTAQTIHLRMTINSESIPYL
jgi:hypothetical protein